MDGAKVMRECLGPVAAVFLRELTQMTVGIGASSEFVQARPAEGAVRGVPPDEVGNSRCSSKHYAQREEKQNYSTSHRKAKYSTGPDAARRRGLLAASRLASLLAD